MNEKEREFYQDLYPCLQDENWWYTGAQATTGLVWWRLELLNIEYDELSAEVEIGLKRGMNHASFFVQIQNTAYPNQLYTKNLTSDPGKVSNNQVIEEAERLALLLLVEKSEVIREEREAFKEKLKEWKEIDEKSREERPK